MRPIRTARFVTTSREHANRRWLHAPFHGGAQISVASHAHPRPLWHVSLRLMQVLPHAFPLSQTLQHSSAGIHRAASGDLAPPPSREGPASETQSETPSAKARARGPISSCCHRSAPADHGRNGGQCRQAIWTHSRRLAARSVLFHGRRDRFERRSYPLTRASIGATSGSSPDTSERGCCRSRRYHHGRRSRGAASLAFPRREGARGRL
jgi:hypothetical protein